MSCKNSVLATVLAQLQREHTILIARDDGLEFWAGRDIEPFTRQVLARNKRRILKMIDRSEVLVCPSPVLHAPSWRWEMCRLCCNHCARLKRYVN